MSTRFTSNGLPTRKIVNLTVITAGLVLAAFTQYAGATAQTSVDGTLYRGNYLAEHNINEFLGIPFAKAPIEDLRWQPPQPIELNSAQLEVKQFAPACMQEDRIVKWYKSLIEDFGGDPATFPSPEFSEDCLYLNVWAPVQAEASAGSDVAAGSLPVYVYIHGGSNKAGWSYEPNYVGRNLAKNGMVVVTIAYRLGVFGFFPHTESEHTNFALLDQIAALKWVQNNIADFGGDPNRVTLAGESAGADNIAVLLGSPLADGLFDQAVIQSGGWSILSMPDRDDVAFQVERLAENTLNNPKASVDELRALDAKQLAVEAETAFADVGFGPAVGDLAVPMALAEVAENKELNDVDVILGSNTNEYLIYLDPEQTLEQWLVDNPQHAGSAEKILALLDDGSTELEKIDRLLTASEFACPTLKLAAQVAANDSNAYVYYFNMVRDGELGAKMGAYHGAELPYIFNTHDAWLPTTEADHRLTQQMAEYWRGFVAQGSPFPSPSSSLAMWPNYSEKARAALFLGQSVAPIKHPSIELCQLLDVLD